MGLFDVFKSTPKNEKAFEIVAPIAGEYVRMADIPDPVFSGGMMGVAVGISPDCGAVVSPVKGRVIAAMPHAFGFVCDNGVEVIVHIGVDTVEMQGDGFEVIAKIGQNIKVGDPLVVFDREKVAAAGHPDVVIIAVSNSDDLITKGITVSDVANESIQAGDTILKLSK